MRPAWGRRNAGLACAMAAALLVPVAGCGPGGGGGGGERPAPAPVVAAAPAAVDPSPQLDDTSTLARVPPGLPERLGYAAPVQQPGGAVDRRLDRPPARVFDQVQAALRDAGLRISHLDERGGVIAARYDGDPARYLDCGTITAQSIDGEVRRLDAAADAISFRRGQRRSSVVLERDLVLNARLVVQLRPDGNGTRLRSSATYVLGKRTTAGAEPSIETVAFESGGRGSFAKGTICQPTGALERLPLVGAGS